MASNVSVDIFSPSSISNCVQWLDANDITTLFQDSAGTVPVTANGQSVAFWKDKSGSNNSVYQFSSIPVPTYSNLLIGNRPGLDFTNSSHLRSGNFQNSSNITAFVVGMVKNTIQGWGVFWGHFTTSDHDNYISLRNTSGQSVINWHTANDNSVMQMNYVLDSPVIYYGIMSNRFNTFFSQTTTQGTTTVSGNVGGTIASASIPTFVGQSRIQSEAIRSYISEIIYYQRVLTTFEQQQVQGYLAWKYTLQNNLPTTNPYRTFPFLVVPETIPRSIPLNTYILPINTFSTIKTFTLPIVSTNPGRMFILKDYLGFAGSNNIRLSTIGLDRIERSNVSSMVLSNAFGAWTFMNDGLTNWFLMNAYLNTLSQVSTAPSLVTSGLINNVDAATYTSGSTWTALVGNNQTIFGSGTTTTATPGGPNAIVFNGSGYGLDTTGIASSGFLNFTMDLWFFAAASVTGSMVGELGQASQGGWNVTMISITGNIIYVGFWQGSVYQLNCGSYTANTWTHVSYTYSGTTVTGYVNGVQVATGTSTKQRPGNSHYGVASAANPYGNFVGRIGAYKLYNRALSAAEIRQNYNALASRFGRGQI